MAKYQIEATYSYSGEVEANSREEAESLFLDDLNMYYEGTDSFTIEQLDEDEDDDLEETE